jgi:hypothetical protein
MDTCYIMKNKSFTAAPNHNAQPGTKSARKAALNHREAAGDQADAGDAQVSDPGSDDINASAAGEEDPGAALEFMKPQAR